MNLVFSRAEKILDNWIHMLKFIKPKKESRSVQLKDIWRVFKDSLKIKFAMMKPLPGRWPNASSISHCQITDKDPLRFFVIGNSWHLFENRPVKLKKYFGWPYVRTIMNPKIISIGNVSYKSREGCFSFPESPMRTIKRSETVTLKFWTFLGPRIKKLQMYRAAVVQHEIDHMDDTSIHDRYFKRI